MNPDRQAMIEGRRSPKRNITAPRRDDNTRVSKPSRPRPEPSKQSKVAANWVSQDDQEKIFVEDEDKFVLRQSKKKSDIRVREGRARPVDYLAFSLRYIDTDRDVLDDDEEDVEIDVPSPEKIVAALNEKNLQELEKDISSFRTLESSRTNRDYWDALLTIAKDRRKKLSGRDDEGRAVNAVSADVDRILGPKNFEQLEALEKQIKAKLRGDEQIDTDYWEQLLKSLLVFKAKATLRKICDAIRASRIEQLRKQNPTKAELLEADDGGASSSTTTKTPGAPSQAVKRTAFSTAPTASTSSEGTNPPPGTARFASTGAQDFTSATKALYEREVARGISENEEIFTAEEAVSGAQPKWADKYRPRKPQYFNRVQMGYEWNKYNQTHYDHDNPPPKVVQGYKFNIFYPDLIDKTKAPTYKIIREGGRRRGESFAPAGEEDTCLIRFIAGPPYEDVAFRIVDREWDFSAKKERGFKSSFDKVCVPSCLLSFLSLAIPRHPTHLRFSTMFLVLCTSMKYLAWGPNPSALNARLELAAVRAPCSPCSSRFCDPCSTIPGREKEK